MKRKLSVLGIVALAVVAGGVAAWVSLTPVAAEQCDCLDGSYWTPLYVGEGVSCAEANADFMSQITAYTASICEDGTCNNEPYYSDCWSCGQGLICKSGRLKFQCQCCGLMCDQHD